MKFRCDSCGRFIALSDLEDKRATRKLITPDSHYSKEEYETLCEKCALIEKGVIGNKQDTESDSPPF